MSEILHPLYLPFTQEQLRGHFAPAGTEATSTLGHLAYYVKSAQAARTGPSFRYLGRQVR